MLRASTPAPHLQRQIDKLFAVVRFEARRDACVSIPVLLLVMRRFEMPELPLGEPYSMADMVRRENEESSETEVFHLLTERERFFSQLSREVLHRLQSDIRGLDLPRLPQLDFERLLDYAIERTLRVIYGRTGEWQMPAEVMELLTSVYGVHPGMRVYNPYAGTAEVISFLAPGVIYDGQEQDDTARLLGSVRLIGHQRSAATLHQGLGADPWPAPSKFDLIICARPVLATRNVISSAASRVGYNAPTDVAFMEGVLHHLPSQGRAVVLLAANFLWQSSRVYQQFRQQLVESGVLEAVIEFPSGIVPESSIRLAVLLLNREQINRSQVLLLDAESFVERKGRVHTLNTTGLLAALTNSNSTAAARMVEADELAKQDYSLSPRRHLQLLQLGENQTHLQLIAKPIKKRATVPVAQQLPTDARLLRIRDLKADGVNNTLTTDELPFEYLEERRNVVPLAQSALLIALQGGSLKPTWYEHQSGEVVYLAPFILPLILSPKVDLDYLITELSSDFVQKQVYSLSTKAVIPAIRKPDALNLIVRLPTRKEQEEIAANARNQVVKAALAKVQTAKEDAYTQFAALKHVMLGPLSTLAHGILLLEFVIESHSQAGRVLSLDSLMNPNSDSPTTVRKTLNMMKDARKLMLDTFDTDEAELRVKSYSLGSVEIVEYMSRKIDSIRASEPGFTISPLMEFFTVLGNEKHMWGLLKVYVQANGALLNRLFDNVFTNAFYHGFRGEWSAGNKVQVWMKLDYRSEGRSFVNISVHNNGEPLPAGWDTSRLFVRGAYAGPTGRSGLGGHEAKEIVDYFDGTIQISPSSLNNFTVCYSISLPISETETQDV